VADCKHGFESRWGHHGDVVLIFAPQFHSPGGRDLNLFLTPLVVERFQSLEQSYNKAVDTLK
jgi:hypothetical protein